MSVAPNKYLATEVHTAPPQKLQLMLIDGAIRNLQLAKQFWAERQDQAAGERIVRAQEIIAQLISGLNLHANDPLVKSVAAVYTFLFRSLAQAHFRSDAAAVDDVLRVLEIERGTWQQVCRELGNGNATAAPHFGKRTADAEQPEERISFEA